MPDEPRLPELAREAIERRALPTKKPDRTFGGPGSGSACAVCGATITRDQMAWEIEFDRQGMEPGSDRYYLHPRCFAAWEFERTKVPARNP
jgi:hypothetical protein